MIERRNKLKTLSNNKTLPNRNPLLNMFFVNNNLEHEHKLVAFPYRQSSEFFTKEFSSILGSTVNAYNFNLVSFLESLKILLKLNYVNSSFLNFFELIITSPSNFIGLTLADLNSLQRKIHSIFHLLHLMLNQKKISPILKIPEDIYIQICNNLNIVFSMLTNIYNYKRTCLFVINPDPVNLKKDKHFLDTYIKKIQKVLYNSLGFFDSKVISPFIIQIEEAKEKQQEKQKEEKELKDKNKDKNNKNHDQNPFSPF